jgi:DNA invertase Pin-like site-specific DNA recombinase
MIPISDGEQNQSRETTMPRKRTKATRRVAIYARVSTDGQTVTNQLRELRAVANRHGWEIAEIYKDEGISGAKGRNGRPAFDEMLTAAVRKEFDLIMAWSVDRLGRSLQHLVEFLSEIDAKGVDLYLHQQGIDTTTPAGKAMFQMCGVFAEFERAMIKDRINAGLARARAQGKTLGRPRVSAKVEAAIVAARAEGKGIRKVARELGVGVNTVQRIEREKRLNA